MCSLGNSSFWHQPRWWQKEEVVGFFLDLEGGVVTAQEAAPNREKCQCSKASPIPLVLLRTDVLGHCVMTKDVSLTSKHCCCFWIM